MSQVGKTILRIRSQEEEKGSGDLYCGRVETEINQKNVRWTGVSNGNYKRWGEIVLLNIYAPNEKQSVFFQNIHDLLRKYEPQNTMIIGDFNAIFDKDLDRKSSGEKKKIKSNLLQKSFLNLIEEFELLDVWRVKNGSAQQFTFFSNRHQTWSRIDACWMTAYLIKDILEAEILPRSFANHNPLLIKLFCRPKRRTCI